MRNNYFFKAGIYLALLTLVPIAACTKHSAEQHAPETTAQKYHCPMHPTYVSDQPGSCPICGMNLVPMKEQSNQTAVRVDADRQKLLGITTEEVAIRELTAVVRASARVAYDPELYNAISEHRQILSSTRDREGQESAAFIAASESRLRQLGLSLEQIKEVAQPSYDSSHLLLPKAGGKAWVYVDIYDSESTMVKPGQKVELTGSASPGKVYRGTIKAVDNVVNPETRTLRVRVEVSNDDGALRPDMYLNAVIRVALGRALAVPVEAVVETGTRRLVYVETAPGEFEARDVALGKKAGEFYEAISGVTEGDRVVASANFLVDSESKLKTAMQGHKHD